MVDILFQLLQLFVKLMESFAELQKEIDSEIETFYADSSNKQTGMIGFAGKGRIKKLKMKLNWMRSKDENDWKMCIKELGQSMMVSEYRQIK